MWASLDLPSRTPQSQRNPSRPKRLSESLLTRPNCPYTVDHLASHHLTSFLRLLVLISVPRCCCCSPIPVATGKKGRLLVQLVLRLIRHTLGPLPVTTRYCYLIEPKRDCPVLPILLNSTTHHQFHVATALQWPSTIALDASCTHAPTSSPHSRPNTLVAPRCCPPVSPCLSSVAAARLAASLH